MKKYVLIFISITFFVANSSAQDKTKIVESLKLKEVSQDIINNAKLSFMGAYTEKTSNNLFSTILFVGSSLGNTLKSKKYKKLGNATFMVPVLDKNNNIIDEKADVGKIIQDQNDFNLLWAQVKKDLGTSVTFRDLNTNELFRCWELFADKFSHPYFVVENGKKGFIIIMTDDMQILFIDKSIP